MTRYVIMTLWLSAALFGAERRAGFFAQEESAQHFLFEQGDCFRLFRYNLACTNWNYAAFDEQTKQGRQASIRLMDTSPQEDTIIFLHHQLKVQPYTEYLLRYAIRIETMEGAAPVIDLTPMDERFDRIEPLLFTLDGIANKEWQYQQKRFVTSGQTYYLKPHIRTSREGTAVLHLDEMYIEQTSKAQGFRPRRKEVAVLKELKPDETKAAQPVRQAYSVPTNNGVAFLLCDLHWREPDGGATLSLDWQDSNHSVLVSDYCILEPYEGIWPAGNGFCAKWHRSGNAALGDVCFHLERYPADAAGPSNARLSYKLTVPPTAAFVNIRLSRQTDAADGVTIDGVQLEVEETRTQ